ncbi:sigma-70 family RNA polymerase sigma factor [Stieleria sp. TO1_6]|uniref:RNA polymerase sigma factor n=1 Tax=Stieleria tagensis TaxID=2956795 RepID=UPI00209A75D5|nr:sigma-70 family RNA polymerase sigma factor [Stieleria tagensis]MCO8121987.1 sigma-70 family RNA polymerase sigma factor [Stieleria tagensis]
MQASARFNLGVQRSAGRNRRGADSDLIQSAQSGDHAAFSQLVTRYQGRLLNSMSEVVGCPMMAEDIVQETFGRAFRFIKKFRMQSQFYSWLYRIALNVRGSHFRKHRALLALDSVGELTESLRTESADCPAASAARCEARQQVRAALERLPEHYRRILLLREFDGLDYREIGEIMEINMGTVRSRLSRARARLKVELESYAE